MDEREYPPPPSPVEHHQDDPGYVDRSQPGWEPVVPLADGDDYGQMDGGQWLDPDSSEPAQFFVPDIPPTLGRAWSRAELRAFRDGALPALPVYDPITRRSPRAVGVVPDQIIPSVLAGRPSNMDDRGTVHFLRIVGGATDHCGGCEQEWPCAGYRESRSKIEVANDSAQGYLDPTDVQQMLRQGTVG